MKVLLDECAPRRLRTLIIGHEVITVPDAGWAGIKNGELLKKAAETFDVFLTVDRNVSFQQNPASLAIPVIVFKSTSIKLKDLAPLVPNLLQLLQTKLSRMVYTVEA